jgi:serine/threonine protein kinase
LNREGAVAQINGDSDEELSNYDDEEEEEDTINGDSEDDDFLPASHHNSVKRTRTLRVGLLEGTTFLNSYVVVGRLGQGTYGRVKLCLNVADDCLYAVKVVDKLVVGAEWSTVLLSFFLLDFHKVPVE